MKTNLHFDILLFHSFVTLYNFFYFKFRKTILNSTTKQYFIGILKNAFHSLAIFLIECCSWILSIFYSVEWVQLHKDKGKGPICLKRNGSWPSSHETEETFFYSSFRRKLLTKCEWGRVDWVNLNISSSSNLLQLKMMTEYSSVLIFCFVWPSNKKQSFFNLHIITGWLKN